MGGDELIVDLQRMAREFDYYDKDEPDEVGVILDVLRTATPKPLPRRFCLRFAGRNLTSSA